jgi:hypothetical protein
LRKILVYLRGADSVELIRKERYEYEREKETRLGSGLI